MILRLAPIRRIRFDCHYQGARSIQPFPFPPTFRFECETFVLYVCGVKLFYTGPVVNTEMLVVMLEKHGISAMQEFVDAGPPDDGDLNRPARVLVPEADYDRAHQLFYVGREDEL